MQTEINNLLEIEYPIIQGGMAWVAEHHLAAAVSEAGGFGLIGAANAPADWVREQIRKTKELTDRPFGVNVMLMSPYADEVARVIAEEGVKAVTTGAGNPEKYMELWKERNIKVIPVVASVALAKRMERCGADAVFRPNRAKACRRPFAPPDIRFAHSSHPKCPKTQTPRARTLRPSPCLFRFQPASCRWCGT